MPPTDTDIARAERDGMKLLAAHPRPRVPFTGESLPGAFALWRTNGSGAHTDTVRLDPEHPAPLNDTLRAIRTSPNRVPGGSVVIRAVEHTLDAADTALLDRLASAPPSTGYLMACSLAGTLREHRSFLLDGAEIHVRTPATDTEYLGLRCLASDVFGGGSANYDPAADFYSAPDVLTYLGAYVGERPIAAASILVVDDIANIWSVCTRESERGRGAASAVTRACLAEARRQGAHTAVLGTDRHLARPGGLYNRLGFETIGHEHGWTLPAFDRLQIPD
jgi:GNAT superfamily N-acetyltransferase